MLNAANPLGDPIDYSVLEKDIPIWVSKIITLLNHHQIQLLNENEQLWVLMQANTDGKVHVSIFELVEKIQKIQEKAEEICQVTHGSGTTYEAPGAEIYKVAKSLSPSDFNGTHKCIARIAKLLENFCRDLSGEEKDTIREIVEAMEHEPDPSRKLDKIELALSYALSYISKQREDHQPCLIDIVILTVLPEEYKAICNQLLSVSPLNLPPNMESKPNIYAWKFGCVLCSKFNGTYKVAVGMIAQAGNSQSALATKEAISSWRPNYIIFSGIAGDLPNPKKTNEGPKKADIIITDSIHGYEYGKVEKTFTSRGRDYETDQGLLASAIAYVAIQNNWHQHIKARPPKASIPDAIIGEIASGEKVIDDPTSEFFDEVIKMFPKIKAVEMEGARIGSAIRQAQGLKIPVGFMVIRAISDLPRPQDQGDKIRGTEERDAWKDYASDAAAAFTIGWIADGLPLPPTARNPTSIE